MLEAFTVLTFATDLAILIVLLPGAIMDYRAWKEKGRRP